MHSLDKHFRTLTGAAFKQHGFAQLDLLSQWPEIVGEALALVCKPERISWPRQTDRQGGTLNLKVAAGRGLDVQYAMPQILERCNAFLGYQAITQVKTKQTHQPFNPAKERPLERSASENDLRKLAAISDPLLKAALARLAAGTLAASQRSPQAK